MEHNYYYDVFKALGIPIEPLPSNYTPEEFGRRLLSMSKTEHGVSYATSTDYTSTSSKAPETVQNKQ